MLKLFKKLTQVKKKRNIKKIAQSKRSLTTDYKCPCFDDKLIKAINDIDKNIINIINYYLDKAYCHKILPSMKVDSFDYDYQFDKKLTIELKQFKPIKAVLGQKAHIKIEVFDKGSKRYRYKIVLNTEYIIDKTIVNQIH